MTPTDFENDPTGRAAGEEILRAAAVLDRLLTDATEAEGLTPLEARLLRTVREGVPQGTLARLLAVDPARISVLTAQLEERGLLLRVPSPGDRRQRVATLTALGEQAVSRIGARLAAASPLGTRLDRAEREQLIELLQRIVADG